MTDPKNTIHQIYSLEQLSGGDTIVHSLHPAVKLLSAFIFIITVVSFDRYAFGRLIPYVFYPAILMALSETPYTMLLKRFLVALPFCLFAELSNVLFDTAIAFTVGGFAVSYGMLSLFTILFRTYLCVMAVLILVSVTPFAELSAQMRRLKMPNIFVMIFEMTYRYIGVLLEETYSMYTAYSLRSTNQKGIEMRHMGSFVGQLLLRSIDRAERVYNAMKCRGYALHNASQKNRRLAARDRIYFIIVCVACIFFRFIDIRVLLAQWLGGWF